VERDRDKLSSRRGLSEERYGPCISVRRAAAAGGDASTLVDIGNASRGNAGGGVAAADDEGESGAACGVPGNGDESGAA